MARPIKQGVDYFPLDIYLDDKFKFIEIKYKLEGFGIIVKLFQRIYSCGYWCSWGEDEAMLFADENRTDVELVNNVLNEAIERGIFNKNLFDKYQVLTSKGIQERYKKIVERRKGVVVVKEYTLINESFGVEDIVNDSINDSKCEHDVNNNHSKCEHDVNNNHSKCEHDVNNNHSKCEHDVNIGDTSCEHDASKSTQSKVNKTKQDNNKDNLKNKFSDDSLEIHLSNYLFSKIQVNDSKFKKPNFQNWAQQFDYILRIDQRSIDEIKRVIDFATANEFWKSNILSPTKLRSKYSTLLMQSNNSPKIKYAKAGKIEDGTISAEETDAINRLIKNRKK